MERKIKMEHAQLILAATKRMIASLDPELAEKLEIKEGEIHPYLELPGCFYILLRPFAIYSVFYYPQGGGEVVEVFCTRVNQSDKFAQRKTLKEMLEYIATTPYLWLPKDSPGLRPGARARVLGWEE